MKKFFQEAADMLGSVPPLALTLLSLSVVCMNLLANKSIDTGLDWLALDCGILFSGVAFLAMDVMTHCYGPRAATVGSLTALVINLLTAGLFFIASRIPGAVLELVFEIFFSPIGYQISRRIMQSQGTLPGSADTVDATGAADAAKAA